MAKAGHFETLQLMAERNGKVMFGPDILRAQQTKKGTQVTIGIAGSLVADIANGRLNGGLLLWDADEYQATAREIEERRKHHWAPGGTCNACGDLWPCAIEISARGDRGNGGRVG